MKKILFVFGNLALLACSLFGQTTYTDRTINVPPAYCPGTTTNTTGTNGMTLIGASNAPVFQLASSATGTNTHTYTCEIACASRTTPGKGCTVNAFALYYGIQTAALASQTAPACGTVTLPSPGASETASTVTPVSTTVTTLPAIASANLSTTTAGAFYTSEVIFSTPVVLNALTQKLICTFAFPNTATTATTSNVFGGTAFITDTN